MTSLVQEHGRQCMPCFIDFSVMLQTEILLTETSEFLNALNTIQYNTNFIYSRIDYTIYNISYEKLSTDLTEINITGIITVSTFKAEINV